MSVAQFKREPVSVEPRESVSLGEMEKMVAAAGYKVSLPSMDNANYSFAASAEFAPNSRVAAAFSVAFDKNRKVLRVFHSVA